jgi:hypothetical protein
MRYRVIVALGTTFPYAAIRLFAQKPGGKHPFGCSWQVHEDVTKGYFVTLLVVLMSLVTEHIISLITSSSSELLSAEEGKNWGRTLFPKIRPLPWFLMGLGLIGLLICLDYIICSW